MFVGITSKTISEMESALPTNIPNPGALKSAYYYFHTARISILIAICCSGAFADTHRGLHFSAVEPRESKASYVQRSDEEKLRNFAPPQLGTFMPGPTDPVESGRLPVEPSGSKKPEVQLIPESNSDNLGHHNMARVGQI